MKKRRLMVILWSILIMLSIDALSQNMQVGLPFVEERLRIGQLEGKVNPSISFLSRPLNLSQINEDWEKVFENSPSISFNQYSTPNFKYFNPRFELLPIYSLSGVSTGFPYASTSNLLTTKGFQSYLSAGFHLSTGPLKIQFKPELIFSQNLPYNIGLPKSWNIEYIENFGSRNYTEYHLGQSRISLDFGAFSVGASTENLWWGPGQFNSLLFSNNAFGFPHLTFNTRKPAKTFLGSFEGQLVVGRLEGSGLPTTNVQNLVDEWRYLNGITLSYQPKWAKGIYIGLSRVFQQYNTFRGDALKDYLSIFDPFQKKSKFDKPGDSGEFDREGRDQQLTLFGRFMIPSAKAEFYFEYGRRDHAYDWREAFLNPEHARAYLIGFTKISKLNGDESLLFRGEILQQQESINIIVRYPGIGGSLNWGGHGVVRHGFTNYGQMMGSGIGPGSNSQTFEISWINPSKKIGLLIERVNRYQDFYNANFNDPSPANRWVDFSSSFIGDFKVRNLVLTSRLNFIKTFNRDWLPISGSGVDFSIGQTDFSFQGQIGVLIFFSKSAKNSSKQP